MGDTLGKVTALPDARFGTRVEDYPSRLRPSGRHQRFDREALAIEDENRRRHRDESRQVTRFPGIREDSQSEDSIRNTPR